MEHRFSGGLKGEIDGVGGEDFFSKSEKSTARDRVICALA